MTHINLTIKAEAPLAIGQRKPGGSVSEASDYIPGTVIRGAIAGKILQQAQGQEPAPGDSFHALFLNDEAAIFRNAYPAIASLGSGEYEQAEDVRVLPATALSSKTNDGFQPDGHGAFDALIDSYCAREQGLFYEPNDLKGDRVEPFAGFYSRKPNETDDQSLVYRSHSISKRLLTRVGINRQRATAQEQVLYSIEVMDETRGKQHQPMVYQGSIWLPNQEADLAEQLCTFLAHQGDRFRLGGSASRGLGKVSLSAHLSTLQPSESIKERVEAFNAALQDRWKQWTLFGVSTLSQSTENEGSQKAPLFFSLDLTADAILTEHWQRTMVISEAMLCDRLTSLEPGLQLQPRQLKLEMAYSSYDYRSGWNAAWGLPKDVELVTKIGGVFLFKLTAEPSPDFYHALSKLEEQGIGDRTSEGFGQVRVCDEFHQIFREAAV